MFILRFCNDFKVSSFILLLSMARTMRLPRRFDCFILTWVAWIMIWMCVLRMDRMFAVDFRVLPGWRDWGDWLQLPRLPRWDIIIAMACQFVHIYRISWFIHRFLHFVLGGKYYWIWGICPNSTDMSTLMKIFDKRILFHEI